MVQSLFKCEECGAVYETLAIAQKCEEHCRKFNACNMQYLKESVGRLSNSKLNY
ncbi:MAG TPA: hypothetical protein VJ944_02480 [Thermoplasmataceae archaeon]|nr:hypothetical protein [Thermoplasmataceae archaeon]